MKIRILDELLTTLDVRVHAFAVAEIERGFRLQIEAMDAVLVHYVLAGRGVLHQEGEPPIGFAAGNILVVAPGRGQSLACEPVTWTVDASDAAVEMAEGLLKMKAGRGAKDLSIACGTITATYGGGFGLFDPAAGPLLEDVSGLPEFRSAFDLIIRELADPRLGTRALTEALMKQCLILVLREHDRRASLSSPLLLALRDPALGQAVAAVLTRPGAAHTVESLAAEAGMSRSVFAERFYVAYGQTPHEFVQTARLRYAARLLTISDMPVKGIARAVGYASRSHFSRAFRTAFGLDPSSYRKTRAVNDELGQPMAKPPRQRS